MKKSKTYELFRSKYIREHKCPRKGLTKEAFNEREKIFKLLYSLDNAINDLSYSTQNINALMTFLHLAMNSNNYTKYAYSICEEFINRFFGSDMLYIKCKSQYRHYYILLIDHIISYCNINSNIQSEMIRMGGV